MLFDTSHTWSVACLGGFSLSVMLTPIPHVLAQNPSTPVSISELYDRTASIGYDRYQPFACTNIDGRSERQLWRSRRPDTVYVLPQGNPLPAAAVEATRACIATQQIDRDDPRQLLGVGQAYLTVGEDTKARSVFDRLLQGIPATSVEARAFVLQRIVTSYIRATPTRLETAIAYVKQLDAMGASAAAERMSAHIAISSYAIKMDSVVLLRTHAAAAVKASTELSGEHRNQWAGMSIGGYLQVAEAEGRLGNGPAAVATLHRAAQDLEPFGMGIPELFTTHIARFGLYGRPAPALRASTTFLPGQSNATNGGTYPRPGTVSLVIFVSKACGDRCFPKYAVLRRLLDRYRARGLEVILATETLGWYNDRLIPNPSDESQDIRAFFHEELGISAPLLIWWSEFQKDSDGAVSTVSYPNPQAYSYWPAIVDKRGIIRYAGDISTWTEQTLRNVIEALLEE